MHNEHHGLLTGLRNDLRERRQKRGVYKTTLAELSELSDRDLNDLGLNRANLRAVAYEAAYSV